LRESGLGFRLQGSRFRESSSGKREEGTGYRESAGLVPEFPVLELFEHGAGMVLAASFM
jgi:hypothetical protein